ncbi:MAG TPA: PIN domain-containing protein [Candidatus Macondimonas sp.]|nr:PIN domain-containing protein [Candidatus Macondimonas sp.]
MANNYLLIDFENVQPESIALLDGFDFTILLFVGAHQTKIPLALATQLQQLGERARYIRIEGNGPNALDFHIAFTIGELARADPEGYFHIISKDTGFDPLIRYARGRRIAVQRSVAIAEIPLLKRLSAKNEPERLHLLVQNLTAHGNARPRKVTTLANSINHLFRKSLSELEIAGLIAALQQAGHINIDGESVHYCL